MMTKPINNILFLQLIILHMETTNSYNWLSYVTQYEHTNNYQNTVGEIPKHARCDHRIFDWIYKKRWIQDMDIQKNAENVKGLLTDHFMLEYIKKDGKLLINAWHIPEWVFLIDLSHWVRHFLCNEKPHNSFLKYAHWKYMNRELSTEELNDCLLYPYPFVG